MAELAASRPAALHQRRRAIRIIKYALFSASLMPVLVTGAMSYRAGQFPALWFALAGVGLCIGQAGADYLYYYFTHFHTDPRDAHTKIFAGWRPLLMGVCIKPEHTVYAGAACLAADLGIGVYFLTQLGGMIAWLAAVFFTPLRLKGLKEPVIF